MGTSIDNKINRTRTVAHQQQCSSHANVPSRNVGALPSSIPSVGGGSSENFLPTMAT